MNVSEPLTPSPVCEIRAGDTFVVAYSRRLNMQEVDQINRIITSTLPIGSRTLILDGIAQIGVIRGDK